MPDGATPADPPASPTGLTGSAAEQRRHRLAKVEALRDRGIDPYPVTYPRDHTLAQVRERVRHARGRRRDRRRRAGRRPGDAQARPRRPGLHDPEGRERDLPDHGLALGDGGGGVRRRRVDRHRRLDGLRGPGRGEPRPASCRCWRARRSCSARRVRPLPAKTRPLTDTETRARQRYLDLIVTPDARRVADIRTRTIAGIRGYLAGPGFTEVETPVLQPDAGGRDGAALHHAPQRARHRDVPAHRPRAAPEAAHRRRLREGLRDRRASSATRASTRATTPSSRCSRSTRRSRTTTT